MLFTQGHLSLSMTSDKRSTALRQASFAQRILRVAQNSNEHHQHECLHTHREPERVPKQCLASYYTASIGLVHRYCLWLCQLHMSLLINTIAHEGRASSHYPQSRQRRTETEPMWFWQFRCRSVPFADRFELSILYLEPK